MRVLPLLLKCPLAACAQVSPYGMCFILAHVSSPVTRRAAIGSNPNLLPQLLHGLAQTQPDLVEAILRNQQEFLQIIRGEGGEDAEGMEGAETIELTQVSCLGNLESASTCGLLDLRKGKGAPSSRCRRRWRPFSAWRPWALTATRAWRRTSSATRTRRWPPTISSRTACRTEGFRLCLLGVVPTLRRSEHWRVNGWPTLCLLYHAAHSIATRLSEATSVCVAFRHCLGR